jgi:hypothetical protein
VIKSRRRIMRQPEEKVVGQQEYIGFRVVLNWMW